MGIVIAGMLSVVSPWNPAVAALRRTKWLDWIGAFQDKRAKVGLRRIPVLARRSGESLLSLRLRTFAELRRHLTRGADLWVRLLFQILRCQIVKDARSAELLSGPGCQRNLMAFCPPVSS